MNTYWLYSLILDTESETLKNNQMSQKLPKITIFFPISQQLA